MTMHGRATSMAAPNKTLSAEVSAPLLAIRGRFLETVVDRVLVFEALKKDIESGCQPAHALGRVADLAHKIAGVAETLGYPQVGQLAATVEQTIRSGGAAGIPGHQTWRVVEPTLEALLEELEGLLDD